MVAVSRNPTIPQFHDTLGSACDVFVVRDEDQRSAFINETREKIEDFLAGTRVEITCGLIGQDHVGIID
jgi:hypothetical protein